MDQSSIRRGSPFPALAGALLALIAALFGHVTVADARNQAAAQDGLPDGPGKGVLIVVCGSCHDVDTAIGLRHTAADWKQVIEAMINRGALGSDDEFKTVQIYLQTNFGLVNVNAAPAKELEDVLEISSREAEAIVRQRMERGAFTSLDELKMVPGVDPLTVDKRKERIQFK